MYDISKENNFNTVKNMLSPTIDEDGVPDAPESDPVGHIVMYTIDAGNVISELILASSSKGNPGELHMAAEGRGFTVRGNIIQPTAGMDFSARQAASGSLIYGKGYPWTNISSDNSLIVFRTPTRYTVTELNASTISVTDDPSQLLTDTKNYSVQKGALATDDYRKMSGGNAKIESFAVYTLNNVGVPKATVIVLRGASQETSIMTGSGMYIVTGKTTALNDDGEPMTKLYYSRGGAEQSCFINNTVRYGYYLPTAKSTNTMPDNSFIANGAGSMQWTLDEVDLRVGDIIQFATDSDGYISSINRLYRTDSTLSTDDLNKSAIGTAAKYNGEINTTHMGSEGGVATGTVEEVDTTTAKLLIKTVEGSYATGTNGTASPEAEAMALYNVGQNITIYNVGEEKTTSGTLADIMRGDRVIVICAGGYMSAFEVIVLR